MNKLTSVTNALNSLTKLRVAITGSKEGKDKHKNISSSSQFYKDTQRNRVTEVSIDAYQLGSLIM